MCMVENQGGSNTRDMSYDFKGKTVLVTGASGGIGEAFARALAGRGSRLLLIARSEDKLQRLAAELGNAHALAVDLGTPGAATNVAEELARLGWEVDVLINNAGFGLHGRFDEISLAQQRAQIDLNVTALFELTRLFMPTIERRQGGVILVASVAGYFPTPYMSVYGATKAFVLSFGEALWAEYRGRGVRVLTLSPGQTDTGFFTRAGESLKQLKKAAPDDVVRLGLAAFEAERASVVHGSQNWFATWLLRFFPRSTAAKLSERVSRPSQERALAG
jgi:uncharacterized protein